MSSITQFPRILIAAAVSMAVACTGAPDNPVEPSIVPEHSFSVASAARAELEAAAQGRTARGFEDWILRVAERVPGVGGIFTDSTGSIVVLAHEGVDRGRLVSELSQWTNDARLPAALRTELGSRRVEFRPAEYGFSELVAWQHVLLPALLREVPELVATDADESINRIRVSLDDLSARTAVLRIAEGVGVPTDAVRIDHGQRAVLLSNLRGTFQHKAAGVQIKNSTGAKCSAGFNVQTGIPIEASGFLTASHCASGNYHLGATGEMMYSPVVGSQYEVGHVGLNSPWNNSDPDCAGLPCTTADAMFVPFNNPSHFAYKVFITQFVGVNNAGGSITTTGWWTNIQPPVVASVGHSVDKVGRTTGWTRGTVAATCENVPIGSPASEVHLCSVKVVNSRVGQGDSGAPVFFSLSGSSGTPLYPAGILFAGGFLNSFDQSDFVYYCSQSCFYYYSPLAAIDARLGRSFAPEG